MSPTERAIMDKVNEERGERAEEYVAPAIIDYGTLVEITAGNHHNDLSDVIIGSPVDNGFSAP
jgi:hypothetical protein